MAKLGVITDGISREFEHALDVMKEHNLRYAELQFLWDKEAGDLDDIEIGRVQDLVKQYEMKVCCISRHNFAGMLVGRMTMVMSGGLVKTLAGFGLLIAAIVVGSATVWIGPADPLALAPAAAGLVFIIWLRNGYEKKALQPQKV